LCADEKFERFSTHDIYSGRMRFKSTHETGSTQPHEYNEELLERKSSSFGLETEIMAIGEMAR
jgi:hypothetical protein